MDLSHNLGPLSLVEWVKLKGIQCLVPLTNWWGVVNGSPLQGHSYKTSRYWFSFIFKYFCMNKKGAFLSFLS